jgi:hypothetical protein
LKHLALEAEIQTTAKKRAVITRGGGEWIKPSINAALSTPAVYSILPRLHFLKISQWFLQTTQGTTLRHTLSFTLFWIANATYSSNVMPNISLNQLDQEIPLDVSNIRF